LHELQAVRDRILNTLISSRPISYQEPKKKSKIVRDSTIQRPSENHTQTESHNHDPIPLKRNANRFPLPVQPGRSVCVIPQLYLFFMRLLVVVDRWSIQHLDLVGCMMNEPTVLILFSFEPRSSITDPQSVILDPRSRKKPSIPHPNHPKRKTTHRLHSMPNHPRRFGS
jgi:hypothetical protein